ncbi:DUF3159 domain-containing protein [Homoserinibacter sp. YIM 151385]|uniref:DUF3159 domain-containing protein n=1 Tax=Homoserinibacter sp. YIM 151385 TaxID=2985506 RepID=UPI0022F025FE|nr:DUF3159 domain-containing protein [Homoserinibacter sp. YIM 151385]WBU38503.1 DUF3159 domain-containing protein [Homoserinibacter sp. YIM 151385]
MADDADRAARPAEGEGAPDREPETFSEALAVAARRSGLGSVTPGEAPSARALLGAMGGVRGLVESILPGLGFLVVFTATQELLPSVLAPLAVAVVFVVARLVQRQPVTTALAGVLGVGISAALALISGRAENNFVPGFFINAGTASVMVVSIAVRWPLVGLIVGYLTGQPTEWREDRAKLRVAVIATSLWAALSALRLAVQLPLWALEQTQALAATKLVMGVPLYAGLLWVTWLLVRTAWTPRNDGEPASGV